MLRIFSGLTIPSRKPPESGFLVNTSLFGRGSPRSNCFGSMFGDYGKCGAFPTTSPQVRRQQSITVQDSPNIVRLHSHTPKSTRYMCFDEAYFKNLESMQWNRDNGYVELIPIVVGIP